MGKVYQKGTDREHTTPQLSSETIQGLIDALPSYAMVVDSKHHILYANKAVVNDLGIEPRGIIGQYCPKVIHGLDAPWHACPLEEAVQTGQSVEREAFDQQSGRWIRSAIYPIRGAAGRSRNRIFFHTVTDVTDRKQAEEQLIASREQLRNLSQHLESVREEERTNLAREVHDELGHC